MKLDAASGWGDEAIDAQVESRGLLMELYKDTGTAKIPAIGTLQSCVCVCLCMTGGGLCVETIT